MKIYWSKKSESRFLEIIDYLTGEFGQTVGKQFKSRTLDFLEILSKFPQIGTLEVPSKQIYGFQLSKQTRLYYRIKNNNILLLTFFDSRQNPDKKPK